MPIVLTTRLSYPTALRKQPSQPHLPLATSRSANPPLSHRRTSRSRRRCVHPRTEKHRCSKLPSTQMPPVPAHRSRVGRSWLPARWMLGTVYHYVRRCGWTSDAVTEEPDSGYCRVRVHRYEGREQAKPACAVRSGEETVTGRDTRGLPGWALFLHLDAVGCVCSVCENAGRL